MTGFPGNMLNSFDNSPWSAGSGRLRPAPGPRDLYTPEQRSRRDRSPWTRVQAILAPLQFAAFAGSLLCVLHVLATGHGWRLAAASVVLKTAFLLAIMTTGAFWEKSVFGQYLFAPSFFWEDVIGFLVIGLHLASVVALFSASIPEGEAMLIALAAYAAYLINAAQFVLKLREARRSAGHVLRAVAS